MIITVATLTVNKEFMPKPVNHNGYLRNIYHLGTVSSVKQVIKLIKKSLKPPH